jgi:cytochrome P450
MYEIMRLFPVLGTLPRQPNKDELLLGKYWIPKGASIGPDLVSLHRNDKYWGSTCNQFDPSRFDNRNKPDEGWHSIMDGKLRIPVKGAFIPFGDGPRNCLGNLHRSQC